MIYLLSAATKRHCRCGALCEGTQSRCRKCAYRATWYRRKAWRTNSAMRPPLGLTLKEVM
jgi:hypothetical protein